MSDSNSLPDITHPQMIRSGRLDVGDGHEIYWVDWGNESIDTPIFYLHGGPGGGFDESDFDQFDPKRHRVIFHDQRGSSRSTPFASIQHNTTADLISDIKKLKQHLGFTDISLFGKSWGSTLALLYAIENPAEIKRMIIGGIFLARKIDREFYLEGRIKSHFPEAWKEFCEGIPSSQNIAEFYKEKMFNSDQESERKRFARRWMKYESSILKLDYQPEKIEKELDNFASESLAYLEAHYILNNCFIEENFILENAQKINHIPTIIIQGRYDFICMPSAALDLANAIGDRAILHFVQSGHDGSDIVQREVTKAYLSIA